MFIIGKKCFYFLQLVNKHNLSNEKIKFFYHSLRVFSWCHLL